MQVGMGQQQTVNSPNRRARLKLAVRANQATLVPRQHTTAHLQLLHDAASLLLLSHLHSTAAAAAATLLPCRDLRRRCAVRRQRRWGLRCRTGLQPAPGRSWPPIQPLAALLRRQGRHCARAEGGGVQVR